MHITATLKPHGHIAESWAAQYRLGGTVSGVRFTKQPDGRFTADDLSPDAHEALRHNPAVEISLTGISIVVRSVPDTFVTPPAPGPLGLGPAVPPAPVPLSHKVAQGSGRRSRTSR